MKKKLPPLKLIDFKAVTKHAYYSGQDPEALFDDEAGKPVNTWQYGAQRLIERYSEDLFGPESFDPNNTIVCHDGGTEYRSAVFPEYKANRAAKKSSKIEQDQIKKFQDWAKRLFAASGILQVFVEGVEADDILAYLCQSMPTTPKEVFTVDGDLTQLVDMNTIVYLKNEPYWPGEVDNYKGTPFQFVSLSKSIVGDKSDNYGGVK